MAPWHGSGKQWSLAFWGPFSSPLKSPQGHALGNTEDCALQYKADTLLASLCSCLILTQSSQSQRWGMGAHVYLKGRGASQSCEQTGRPWPGLKRSPLPVQAPWASPAFLKKQPKQAKLAAFWAGCFFNSEKQKLRVAATRQDGVREEPLPPTPLPQESFLHLKSLKPSGFKNSKPSSQCPKQVTLFL